VRGSAPSEPRLTGAAFSWPEGKTAYVARCADLDHAKQTLASVL